jgi:hypothetical protein
VETPGLVNFFALPQAKTTAYISHTKEVYKGGVS